MKGIDTMINANDARRKATETNYYIETHRNEICLDWINNICEDAIHKATQDGRFKTSVKIPRNLNSKCIANELRANGFIVTINWGVPNNYITIRW